MRIVTDNCPTVTIDSGTIYGKHFAGKLLAFYGEQDTIFITDEEWDMIFKGYSRMRMNNDGIMEWQSPSQYLRGLLELKEGKWSS